MRAIYAVVELLVRVTDEESFLQQISGLSAHETAAASATEITSSLREERARCHWRQLQQHSRSS